MLEAPEHADSVAASTRTRPAATSRTSRCSRHGRLDRARFQYAQRCICFRSSAPAPWQRAHRHRRTTTSRITRWSHTDATCASGSSRTTGRSPAPLCTRCRPGTRRSAGPDQWRGTELSFELHDDGTETGVLFTHAGLGPPWTLPAPLQHEVGVLPAWPDVGRRRRCSTAHRAPGGGASRAPHRFSFRWNHLGDEDPCPGSSLLVAFTLVAEAHERTRLRVVEHGPAALTWSEADTERYAMSTMPAGSTISTAWPKPPMPRPHPRRWHPDRVAASGLRGGLLHTKPGTERDHAPGPRNVCVASLTAHSVRAAAGQPVPDTTHTRRRCPVRPEPCHDGNARQPQR